MTMADDPFAPVREVASLMRSYGSPWYVAGGWAIDLFLGYRTRVHEDVDVAIFRVDQRRLRESFPEWRFAKIEGRRPVPWTRQEWLRPPVHEIHAADPARGTRVEFLMDESSEGLWRFRRDPTVTRAVNRIAHIRWGLPFLAPEIVLLYKAKTPTPKDERDFDAVLPALRPEPRAWLRNALAVCHPGHMWTSRL